MFSQQSVKIYAIVDNKKVFSDFHAGDETGLIK